MKRKLKQELVKLSTDILTAESLNEIADLYEASKGLYEKITVLKFINDKLNDVDIDVSKNEIAAKFETMANAVINGNTAVPESNPHEEDIMTSGMDTIKDMVSEMPSKAKPKEVLQDFIGEPTFIKNEKEILMPDNIETSDKASQKSLNDILNKNFTVGLNDRLAFVNHLFNNNTEDFNRVISQLNIINTEERSISFINNMVKPEYNNWEGKEEYVERLLSLVSRKFN